MHGSGKHANASVRLLWRFGKHATWLQSTTQCAIRQKRYNDTAYYVHAYFHVIHATFLLCVLCIWTVPLSLSLPFRFFLFFPRTPFRSAFCLIHHFVNMLVQLRLSQSQNESISYEKSLFYARLLRLLTSASAKNRVNNSINIPEEDTAKCLRNLVESSDTSKIFF